VRESRSPAYQASKKE